MKLLVTFLSMVAVLAADAPRIVLSKSFPGSNPPFVSFEISKDGSTVYKEAPNDDAPVRFKLSPEEVSHIFALSEKLEFFKKPLESPLKVANMGQKIFRYENGTEQQEVKFNYSQDLDAQALLDTFERLSETQFHLMALERTVRFDKLGVNKSLLQFEAALDRKRLIGPERFLPLLDRVAKNEAYLHMARERAAGLADAIRNPKPKAE
jgi:hypothetical protein